MTTSKRETIKAQRTKKKRQQRMTTLLWVGGFIVVVIIILISPTIYNSLKPAGSFTHITPVPRPMENGKTIGNPNAKVKIQVYEDFQCPSCKLYTENIEPQLLQSTYITDGLVYYEFMQWPFIDSASVTKESHQAANASMCALEQGRFWDYHDILFANQGAENGGSYTDKRLQAFAESIGLDTNKFNKCFKDNTYSAEIENEYQGGVTIGINSTPSVLLNGNEITPGVIPSYDQIKSAIDAALSAGG